MHYYITPSTVWFNTISCPLQVGPHCKKVCCRYLPYQYFIIPTTGRYNTISNLPQVLIVKVMLYLSYHYTYLYQYHVKPKAPILFLTFECLPVLYTVNGKFINTKSYLLPMLTNTVHRYSTKLYLLPVFTNSLLNSVDFSLVTTKAIFVVQKFR